ncbi:hypothetical protein RMATCC62417_13933 [Rhizopus microsporus]|nr:hypothetical protein RMATCC62417_13933 [Rhizopus microsporus]
MEERRSLRKSFQEWLSIKRNSSTPQPPLNATATLDNEQHQPEDVKPQKSHTLIMESVRVDFPLKPYPAQLQMMSKIIHALNRSENALLESPTGSGKSLALLCAALAWRDNERKKLAEKDAQEREERAKAMLNAATEELENVSEKRTRNEEMIPHNMEDAARSAGSFEIDEKALNTVKIELTQVIKGGFEVHSHQILEHLFDGLWEWITSSDNIYNKQDYERHICVWSGQKIIEKLKELSITAHIFETQFIPAYKAVSAHAEAIRKEAEDRSLYDELDREDPEVTVHRRRCLSNNSLTIVRGIFLVFGYLFKEDCDYAEDYRMALMKRMERGGQKSGRKKNNSGQENVWTYKLGFWCLNPGIIFQDMCATTKSVILTSGTLSPMDSFASELQTKFVSKLEANHVIDPSQVWVSCLPTGPSGTSLKGIYTNMESFRYQDDVGEAIWKIAEVVPFGILCFLPSYNALDKLMERWNATGMKKQIENKKLILCEPKGQCALQREIKMALSSLQSIEEK